MMSIHLAEKQDLLDLLALGSSWVLEGAGVFPEDLMSNMVEVLFARMGK